jgi:hypothetical protein
MEYEKFGRPFKKALRVIINSIVYGLLFAVLSAITFTTCIKRLHKQQEAYTKRDCARDCSGILFVSVGM